ncbi:MAG: Uncharacterized protein G01um10147_519 [Microgenomates group bacterium Gr01-1014_7]|nr:MAG: Uncharacterized protein G01um10147_519 [Microgenomates group bacterium Gr01-1014_7]
MTYQIDQSGKIEQTSKDTVIAYSNGTKFAVVVPRRLKRKVQEIFRLHGFTSLFVYYLFSVGVFYLLSNLKEKSSVTIDTEYPGKDKIIKQFATSLLKNNNKIEHEISFARIGNRPPAHYAAKDVFDKKIKPDKILNLEDIIKAIKKTDGRLRECISTLVDAQARSTNKRYHKPTKKSIRKKKK